MALATHPGKAVEAATHPMTPQDKRHLGALERRIAAGLQTFREVGASLLEIRDKRLYRETHASFEVYCEERWGMARNTAYRLIDSAKVVHVLGDPEDLTNEAQARELAPLTDEPDMAKAVWLAVEKRAEETHKPVTANLIRQVREEVVGGGAATVIEQSMTDRLVQDISRLGSSWSRWRDSKPNVGERRRVSKAMKDLIASVS
jgi:hypothetical protein